MAIGLNPCPNRKNDNFKRQLLVKTHFPGVKTHKLCHRTHLWHKNPLMTKAVFQLSSYDPKCAAEWTQDQTACCSLEDWLLRLWS